MTALPPDPLSKRFIELIEKAKTCLALAELEAVSAALEGQTITDPVRAQVEAARAGFKLLDDAGVRGERGSVGAWNAYIAKINGREYQRTACGSFELNGYGGANDDYITEALLRLTTLVNGEQASPAMMRFGLHPMEKLLKLNRHTLNSEHFSPMGFKLHGVLGAFDPRIPESEIRIYRAWPVDDLDHWCANLSGWTR